jgi:7-cyano-7-deazaguanine synthase
MTAVALLSGGLDSTVAAALAQREHRLRVAITADYGQRAAVREIAAARRIANVLGCEHRVIELPFLAAVTRTALVARDRELPALAADQLDEVAGAAAESMRAVWVPNRNGLLLAAAAAIAEGLDATVVIVGFNREEAATFPDNGADFLAATTAALRFSTANGVRVESPTVELDKREVVAEGIRIGAPLPYVWSCYRGQERHCGRCESCLRLFRALDGNGVRERFLAAVEAGSPVL